MYMCNSDLFHLRLIVTNRRILSNFKVIFGLGDEKTFGIAYFHSIAAFFYEHKFSE